MDTHPTPLLAPGWARSGGSWWWSSRRGPAPWPQPPGRSAAPRGREAASGSQRSERIGWGEGRQGTRTPRRPTLKEKEGDALKIWGCVQHWGSPTIVLGCKTHLFWFEGAGVSFWELPLVGFNGQAKEQPTFWGSPKHDTPICVLVQ